MKTLQGAGISTSIVHENSEIEDTLIPRLCNRVTSIHLQGIGGGDSDHDSVGSEAPPTPTREEALRAEALRNSEQTAATSEYIYLTQAVDDYLGKAGREEYREQSTPEENSLSPQTQFKSTEAAHAMTRI